MDLELAGRVAWVTGASSGLGRAVAASLAREGTAVALSARREDLLAQEAARISERTGSRCVAVPLDVTSGPAIIEAAERVASELGPVDVLVANAGGPPPGEFASLGENELHAGFALTTASAWRLAASVLPSMRERRSGCVIFLTSSSTKEVIPGLLLSNMMRPAVVGLAKTLSKEVGPDGVRILCVAPGRIETARLQDLDEANAKRSGTSVEEVRKAMHARIPLRRYGTPEELADVVAFLASPRASYVSGISVLVDGGLLDGALS